MPAARKTKPAFIAFIALFILTSFVDFDSGEYLIRGNIFINNLPLKNDSVKFVLFYRDKIVAKEDITTIYTSGNGAFEKSITWFTPCPSSFRPKECKDYPKAKCDSIKIASFNADSIGFVYGKQQLKFASKYDEAIRLVRRTGEKFIYLRDVHFTRK